MTKPVCLVTGVGPGTGTAIVRRFAKHYQVAMLARSTDRLARLESELINTKSFPCDVSDLNALRQTIGEIGSTVGAPSVLIHNAVAGAFGDYASIQPERLELNFRVNTTALLVLAQELAPSMIDRGAGAMVCTGNTAAYRGVPNFAGFAPTKAAQRILLESLARTLGPKGIHVGYVAIDAVIDLEWTRQRQPERPDEYFAHPTDIAEQVWTLVHQAKSTWTFDLQVRPFGERW